MRCKGGWPILLAMLVVGGWAVSQAQRKKERMTAAEVVEHVKRKDWDIVEEPGHFGPEVVAALAPLLKDRDKQVRELTVHCIGMAGGAGANQALLQALNDPIETVSAAAVRELAKHYAAADIPAMRKQMVGNSNEYVREQLALILGKTDDKSHVPVLEARQHEEPSEEARHAIVLALARLGEEASRAQIRERLLQLTDARLRVRALQDLPYVNDRGLLRDALPLLDDERLGLNVGPSHGPYWIRVCDVVVIVMDEMLQHPFSFPVGRRKYQVEELNEAKRVLG